MTSKMARAGLFMLCDQSGAQDLGRCKDGKDVGTGVRFSPDGETATRRQDGEPAGEIPMGEALKIVNDLTLVVPPPLIDKGNILRFRDSRRTHGVRSHRNSRALSSRLKCI